MNRLAESRPDGSLPPLNPSMLTSIGIRFNLGVR